VYRTVIRRIVRNSGQLPSSIFIRVENIDILPFGGGGQGNVYRCTHEGSVACVKVPQLPRNSTVAEKMRKVSTSPTLSLKDVSHVDNFMLACEHRSNILEGSRAPSYFATAWCCRFRAGAVYRICLTLGTWRKYFGILRKEYRC
jgi:hypothetical protein